MRMDLPSLLLPTGLSGVLGTGVVKISRKRTSPPRAVSAVRDGKVFLIGREPTSPPRTVGGGGALNGKDAQQTYQDCQGF